MSYAQDLSTMSIAIELDIRTTPPSVKDVVVTSFCSSPAYRMHPDYHKGDGWDWGHGPHAILAEITGRSYEEAKLAIRGILENEKQLAWVLTYPGITNFLTGYPRR